MKIYKINNYLFGIVFFFTFLGFYSVLLLGINADMSGFTRQLTIPMRILIDVSCLSLLLLGFRNRRIYIKWFILFTFIYLTRIFIDINNLEFFYISYSEVVLYFISFCVIPFISISKIDFSKIHFKKLYNVFLISALLFSSLSTILYSRFIREVYRLNTNSAGEEVISPLILSYCSALIISVSIIYLIFNKTSKLVKSFSILAIIMAVIPFFLGASRGGIIAVFFPFILLVFCNTSLKNFFKYLLFFIVLIVGLVYLDDYFESGLLTRFLSTSEAIETGGSSAHRIDIWKNSLTQFLNYPFFGDKLNTQGVNYYPHNIYIEVLQSTGIIGFIPFLILLIKGFVVCMTIFKRHGEYAWIGVFFVQALIQNMFSGALYTAAWFWTSLAMMLSLNIFLNNEKNPN